VSDAPRRCRAAVCRKSVRFMLPSAQWLGTADHGARCPLQDCSLATTVAPACPHAAHVLLLPCRALSCLQYRLSAQHAVSAACAQQCLSCMADSALICMGWPLPASAAAPSWLMNSTTAEIKLAYTCSTCVRLLQADARVRWGGLAQVDDEITMNGAVLTDR
jgi:hypothetical protein